MNKPANISKQAWLKSQANESHNPDSIDERIIAFVRLMARCAAEEDYQKSRTANNQQDIKGGK